MANKTLFSSLLSLVAPAQARNEAGGRAYHFGPRHELAQYAATGCLNGTFYADAAEQLDKVLALCAEVDAEFIAKTAVYTREQSHMKDMPALLCAVLASRDGVLLERIFPRVIDNGKMLRNFVQIVRSGVTGRRSLGTRPRRLVRNWFSDRTPTQVFRQSIGTSPSVADILKMVHPNPGSPEREALYGWLLGVPHNAEALSSLVREFEAFKAGDRTTVPDVPFQMLTALDLGPAEWTLIAQRATWQTLRMNLNTFARHGVFNDERVMVELANRLSDANEVRRSRAFPYQLFAAWSNLDKGVPGLLGVALQEAMEVAVANVPRIDGRVYVCPDVSGSMSSPVTGHRRGSTSKVRCIDVTALVAAAVLRQNPEAEVLPFEHRVCSVTLNPRESVVRNAARLAAIGGGGTSCSAPLAEINKRRAHVDAVIFVSDNESWVDSRHARGTETMNEWQRIKARCPQARMVCIDIQPYGTTQAPDRPDILNIGGFSDTVFNVAGRFLQGKSHAHWVDEIEATSL